MFYEIVMIILCTILVICVLILEGIVIFITFIFRRTTHFSIKILNFFIKNKTKINDKHN